MKRILIIDDEDKFHCPFYIHRTANFMNNMCKKSGTQCSEVNCPLLPLPEPELIWNDSPAFDCERGWNACLKHITGENIDED